jgi:hypothetical protein
VHIPNCNVPARSLSLIVHGEAMLPRISIISAMASSRFLVIPGVVPQEATDRFVQQLDIVGGCCVPAGVAPYNPWALERFTQTQDLDSDLVVLAYSAGCVGALGWIPLWQRQKKTIKALIAIDGWPIPFWHKFPLYRVSHDFYTHRTTLRLGAGLEQFYCEPAVEHRRLWTAPEKAWGLWNPSNKPKEAQKTTALDFLQRVLKHHLEP